MFTAIFYTIITGATSDINEGVFGGHYNDMYITN